MRATSYIHQQNLITLYDTIRCTTTSTCLTFVDTPTCEPCIIITVITVAKLRCHRAARADGSRVRSIHVNPANDTFVSAGDDRTVRLWDLRSQNCQVSPYFRVASSGHADKEQGLSRDIGGSAIVAFDNTGQVFAVACSQTQTIALYNAASIDHVSISSLESSCEKTRLIQTGPLQTRGRDRS